MTVVVGVVGASGPVKLGLAALLGGGVFLLARRHLAAGVVTTVFLVACGSSSVIWLKYTFLTARWGPLAGLAAAVVWSSRRSIRWRPMYWVLIAMVGFGFLSAAWSITPSLTLQRTISLAVLLVVAFLLALEPPVPGGTTPDLRAALVWLTPAFLVASLVVLAVQPHRAFRGHEFQGFFENPNAFGLIVGLTYAFMYGAVDRRWRNRAVVWFSVPAVALTIVSGSRSGFLAILVSAVAYEIARQQRRRLYLHVATVIVPIIAIVVVTSAAQKVTGASAFSFHHASGESFLTSLTGARNEAWSTTSHFIAQRPLQGYGFGTGDQVFAHFPSEVHFLFYEGALPDNAYLQIVMEIGVIGAALFLTPLFAGAIRTLGMLRRGARSLSEATFGAALLAAILALSVEGVLEAAGAPWAFVIWLCVAVALEWPGSGVVVGAGGWDDAVRTPRPLPRALRPLAAHPLAAAAFTGLLAIAVAVFVGLAIRGGKVYSRADATAAGESLAAVACNGRCSVGDAEQLANAVWRIRLDRGSSRFSCFLIDLRAFQYVAHGSTPGTTPVPCTDFPLRKANVLTVATPYSAKDLAAQAPDPTYLRTALGLLQESMNVPSLRFVTARVGTLPRDADAALELTDSPLAAVPNRTHPLLYFHFIVIGRPGDRVPRLGALKRMKLGVYGTLPYTFLQTVGHYNFRAFASLDDALAALHSKQIGALVTDMGTASNLLPTTGVKPLGQFADTPFAYVLHTQPNPRLVQAINSGIDSLVATNRLQATQANAYPVLASVPVLH